MKKILLVLALLLNIGLISGQSNLEVINYQAVAISNGFTNVGNDIPGMPLANKNIKVKFSIIQGSAYGVLLYEETQETKTDNYGLFALNIGEGAVTSNGSYSSLPTLPWGDFDMFLKVEMDVNAGNNFVLSNIQLLTSVPYALYATKANGLSNAAEQALVETVKERVSADYLDNDPTNELQELSLINNELSITGSDVVIDLSYISPNIGADGNGITSTVNNNDGTYTFNYSDGSSFTTTDLTGPQGVAGNDGAIGQQGLPGSAGATGNGITSTVNNNDGTYTFNYSDGSSFTTADLTGPQGVAGNDGAIGPQGLPGSAGATGNGITSTVNNNDGTYTFNYSDGSSFITADLTGPQGVAGNDGLGGLTNAGDSIVITGNGSQVNPYVVSVSNHLINRILALEAALIELDSDDDDDGFLDSDDDFPLDPTEDTDTDNDGTGDNADNDDDNDGVLDEDDDFPLDPTEDTDTDNDGTGDNTDIDDDDDGTLDDDDDFPLDPTEDTDTDNDGTGDNADNDDDDDGTLDDDDDFPLDPTEDTDTDNDGTGDNADTDDDGDGVIDTDDSDHPDFIQPSIGDYRFGGIVFWLDPSNNNHGLVVSMNDLTPSPWGCYNTLITNANLYNITEGRLNTDDILNECGELNTGANYCKEYTFDGYSDWFLPSYNTLKKIDENFSYINSKIVQNSGSVIKNNWYWSSTQSTASSAYRFYFQESYAPSAKKYSVYFIRAVRSF